MTTQEQRCRRSRASAPAALRGVLGLAALGLACAGAQPVPPRLGHAPHYAATSWSTLHRDARNSDYTPFVSPLRASLRWRALEGAALFVGPTIGPEGHVYASSGRGVGTAHLHAFDRDGTLLWESAPMGSLDDLDHGAVINAPVVDARGDVYQADLDQLWSFTADGALRWVASLRDAGAAGHFVTPILTAQGHVGGITTDGKLLLFDRESGALAGPLLDLPGAAGPPARSAPPGLLAGGLLAPEFVQPIWNLIHGWEIEVANTPAVHPSTGRIYITAAGETPGSGVLYGIDTLPRSDASPEAPAAIARIAFATPMTGGSGTSPAISPDGTRVFAAGEDGVMLCVDGSSGEVLWRAPGVQAAASPAVGADGTVYSFDGAKLVALDGQGGALRWSVAYDAVAVDALPASPERGPRVARINGIITVSARDVLIAVDLGYEMTLRGRAFVQPHRSVLVAVDPADGAVRGVTAMPGSSSAILVPDRDGRIYASLVDAATSMQFYGINPLLPEALRAPGPPRAGLVAFAPASARGWLRRAVDWARERAAVAARAAALGRAEAAREQIDVATAQIDGLAPALEEALRAGELVGDEGAALRVQLAQARARFAEARAALGGDPAAARRKLGGARAVLLAAAAVLAGR